MATIAFTEIQIKNINIVTWGPMVDGDVGQPYIPTFSADKSIQVEGTFGADTITVQGTNYQTAGNWETLNDPSNNPLLITSKGVKQILQATYQIRPIVTGGDGSTSVTVTMAIHRYMSVF